MRITLGQKNAAKETFVPPVAHSRLSWSQRNNRMLDAGKQVIFQEILAPVRPGPVLNEQ